MRLELLLVVCSELLPRDLIVDDCEADVDTKLDLDGVVLELGRLDLSAPDVLLLMYPDEADDRDWALLGAEADCLDVEGRRMLSLSLVSS